LNRTVSSRSSTPATHAQSSEASRFADTWCYHSLHRKTRSTGGSIIDTPKVALVVGAQEVIGRNLIGHLQVLGDWEIVGLPRRPGQPGDRLRHIAVDLLDPGDARAKLAGLTAVTHIFYAAFQDRPSWAALVASNLAMLTKRRRCDRAGR
jgi:hypothetical protein